MRHYAIALTAFLILFSVSAQAQKIAVADADYIMNEAAAAKSLKTQLKSQQDKFQKEFQSVQSSLQAEEKTIIEKRPNLTEDEFRKQIVAFRSKTVGAEKKFNDKKKKAGDNLNAALKELEKEIGAMIQQIANEKGYSYVLSKQNLLFAAAGQPNITQEVLKRLNEKVKTIALKSPE